MTLSIPKKKWSIFNTLMESRGVEATIVGEFTNSGKCIVKHNYNIIMDIDLSFLHDGLASKKLESEKIIKTYSLPKIDLSPRGEILEELLKNKNIGGYSFISNQYDHEVQASSVLKPPSGRGLINTDAQVFRPILNSLKGVVLSTGIYPSYGDISTYHMSACAIDTAIRNAISVGGTISHLAILDNFCWCSSYDKARLAELVDSVKAYFDYSVGYGTPLISGKDSMFNDFKGYDQKGNPVAISIPPTLLISAIGVIDDIHKVVSPEFKNNSDVIYVLGETFDELGASEYYKILAKKNKNNAIGNNVPKVDLNKNLKTYKALENVIKKELISSSISVNSRGLVVALAKASVGGMLGCEVTLKDIFLGAELPLFGSSAPKNNVALFSESQGRIVVSISKENVSKFEKELEGISFAKVGKVLDNGKFIITDDKNKKIIEKSVKKLYSIYHDFSNKMK